MPTTTTSTTSTDSVLRPAIRLFDIVEGEQLETELIPLPGIEVKDITPEFAAQLADAGDMFWQTVLIPQKSGIGRYQREHYQYVPVSPVTQLQR